MNVRTLVTPLRGRDFALGIVNGVLFAGVDTLLDPSLVLVTLVSFVIATWQVSQYREQPQAQSSTSYA